MTSKPEQRIVVTGLGATTPVGANVTETWEAVLAGQSGVTLMPFDWVETYQLPVKIAATIKQSPLEVLARVEARRLDPSGQYALIAAREGWADAGTPEVEPERLGVVIGTGEGHSRRLAEMAAAARAIEALRETPGDLADQTLGAPELVSFGLGQAGSESDEGGEWGVFCEAKDARGEPWVEFDPQSPGRAGPGDGPGERSEGRRGEGTRGDGR